MHKCCRERPPRRSTKGISLIALIITIIVIIILAVIILSNGSSDTITKAQEATFRNDISTMKEQLGIYKSTRLITQNDFDERTLFGKVSDYLTRFDKYDEEVEIFGGELAYVGTDDFRKVIAREMGLITDVVTVGSTKFNKPDVEYLPTETIVAIYYDVSNNPQTLTLSQAKNDTSWYDYGAKKWANIKTTNNGNEAYWVWIPRYAYKINTPHIVTAQTINIKFLAGASNVPADGTVLPNDYIVHPAFTFGGVELPGIWVAKFEASSNTPNAVDGSGYYTGGADNTTLQVRVLPNVYSWRRIAIGNAQTVCMNITSSSGSIGTTEKLDTHLMKNVEWGAIAYLTHSIYGKNSEVWINPYGDTTAQKMKTGYAGATSTSAALAEGNANLVQYNVGNGLNASTTGNVYGVYDMSGGATEYVAGYINNGNNRLGDYGKATYFTNNILNSEYEKYYDIYEPGDQENQGGIYYGIGIDALWDGDGSVASNTIRKALTDETYAKMANIKGDAMYEVSNGVSYIGKINSFLYTWFKNATDTVPTYARGWNNDYEWYGHAYQPWVDRGGFYNGGSGAGIFCVEFRLRCELYMLWISPSFSGRGIIIKS